MVDDHSSSYDGTKELGKWRYELRIQRRVEELYYRKEEIDKVKNKKQRNRLQVLHRPSICKLERHKAGAFDHQPESLGKLAICKSDSDQDVAKKFLKRPVGRLKDLFAASVTIDSSKRIVATIADVLLKARGWLNHAGKVRIPETLRLFVLLTGRREYHKGTDFL